MRKGPGRILRGRAPLVEQIEKLGLRVVTEEGETVPVEELQGKVFRIQDRDDASGYVVSPTKATGTATVPRCLQAS